MKPRERSADEIETRRALQRLTTAPEWAVFINYFKDRLWREHVPADPSAASALFMQEGRRSLLRELERLPERVRDDRRPDAPE